MKAFVLVRNGGVYEEAFEVYDEAYMTRKDIYERTGLYFDIVLIRIIEGKYPKMKIFGGIE